MFDFNQFFKTIKDDNWSVIEEGSPLYDYLGTMEKGYYKSSGGCIAAIVKVDNCNFKKLYIGTKVLLETVNIPHSVEEQFFNCLEQLTSHGYFLTYFAPKDRNLVCDNCQRADIIIPWEFICSDLEIGFSDYVVLQLSEHDYIVGCFYSNGKLGLMLHYDKYNSGFFVLPDIHAYYRFQEVLQEEYDKDHNDLVETTVNYSLLDAMVTLIENVKIFQEEHPDGVPRIEITVSKKN